MRAGVCIRWDVHCHHLVNMVEQCAHLLMKMCSVAAAWNEVVIACRAYVYCSSSEHVVFTQYEPEVATKSTELCGWMSEISLGVLKVSLHVQIFTVRCYASAVLAMGLCLSVTSRSSTKMAKQRITQTTPHDSTGTLVSDAKDLREIRPGSPPTRAPNAGGVGQNRRLLTNNGLYLENGKR